MQNNILDNIDPIVLGNRLQDSRKAGGLTQQAVADHMEMARTTLVAIEKGERRLTPGELIKLAALYGRQVSDFVGRQSVVTSFVPQFRASLVKEKNKAALRMSSSVAEKSDNGDNGASTEYEQVAIELQRLAEDYVDLENICGMPMAKSYLPPYSIAGIAPEQAAEEIAATERNRLGLGDGPLSNLRERLESDVGLRIFYFKMPPKIAAVFAYNDSLGGCIGINSDHPRDRRNWSLAHEYGHFLTSRYQPEITFLSPAKRTSINERFADSFAECFAMPASGLNRRFTERHRSRDKGISMADLISLADLYQVSVQALILRLENLKRLPNGTWDKLQLEGFKVRQAQHLLGIDANPPMKDALPLRYKTLAVLAYNNLEKLTEEQLMKYLRVSRVQARLIVEEITQGTVAEIDGVFNNLELDLVGALIGGK